MNPPVIKNSNFAKLSALSLCFFRQSMLYCWGKLCRCRLAVWRQLPKLISAGPTPVTCSRQKSALGRFFVWNLSNTGVGGRQGNFVAAGRRSPPTTKQRSSAVFRARPLKARLPSPAPDKKAPFRCSPPYTSGGAVQALRRRSLSQQSTTAPDTATKVSPCRQDCPIQSFPLLSERKKRIFTATLSSSGFISAASPLKRSAAAASPRR